jgi:hypothetical protein
MSSSDFPEHDMHFMAAGRSPVVEIDHSPVHEEKIEKSIPAQFRFAEPTRREQVWNMSQTAHNGPYVHACFLLPGR